MIRSKQLEKVSPVQPTGLVPAQAPSRSRLATVDGCSLSSPNPWDRGDCSSDTTDITLPALHHTLTALAVTVSHRHHSPLIDHCGHWPLSSLTSGVVAVCASTQCGRSGQYGPHSIPPAPLASSPSPILLSLSALYRLSPAAYLWYYQLLQTRPLGSPDPSHCAYHLSRLPLLVRKEGPSRAGRARASGKRATQRLPSWRIPHKDTPSLISLMPCPNLRPHPTARPHTLQTRNFEGPRPSPGRAVVVPSSDRRTSIEACLHLPAQTVATV